MPWNDQSGGPPRSGGGGGQGPWGGGPRQPWGQQRPGRQPPPPTGPDLDEIVRQWRERFFGGGSGGGAGGSGRRGFSAPLIAGLLAVGWLSTGIYTVDEGEQAVITRLGDYNRSTGPGIHFHLPAPIEARQVINVTGQRTAEIGFSTNAQDRIVDNPDESLMITSDRNIVLVQFRVIYNISSAVDFAFNVRDPEQSVRQVAESAMREVIGGRPLERIITTERAAIEQAGVVGGIGADDQVGRRVVVEEAGGGDGVAEACAGLPRGQRGDPWTRAAGPVAPQHPDGPLVRDS